MSANPSQSAASQSIARVLVVDDSAVARGLMTRWIEEDRDLELIGSAVDGEQGLARAKELQPDLIVLDVEMPKMDGLAALPLLLKAVPTCKVVMASTLTRRGGEVTIRALSMGAADYTPKPQAGRLAGADEFRDTLISKLKALAPRKRMELPTATPANVQREGRSPARSRTMMIHSGSTDTKSAVTPEGTKRSAMDTVPIPTPRSAIPMVAALRT